MTETEKAPFVDRFAGYSDGQLSKGTARLGGPFCFGVSLRVGLSCTELRRVSALRASIPDARYPNDDSTASKRLPFLTELMVESVSSCIISGEQPMNNQPLSDRIAIVTGGSSGIGEACARLLAAEGARVIVGYHRGRERAQSLVAELPGTGHSCVAIDLENFSEHEQLAKQLQASSGKLDILVNSAGYTRKIPHADLATLTPQVFGTLLTANATGPYSFTRAMIPLLKASGQATVVNVSSVSAFTGSGSNIAYCAAKAAIDTVSMSLARVFGPQIRFLSVSPASVNTGFVEGRTRDELAKKAAQTPLGRVVEPDDVARAVLACVTHLTTATGVRIVIDGGHTL